MYIVIITRSLLGLPISQNEQKKRVYGKATPNFNKAGGLIWETIAYLQLALQTDDFERLVHFELSGNA